MTPERPTPETDAKERETLNQKPSTHAHYGWKLARRLERERDEARAERDALRAAFDAACAFIDSNVGDSDITSEMVRTYAEFQRHRELLGEAT